MDDPDHHYYYHAISMDDDNDVMHLQPWIWQSIVLVPTAVLGCLLAPMWMRSGAPFAATTATKQGVMLRHISQHMTVAAPSKRARVLYDLGSGDGRLVLAAAAAAQQLSLDRCIGIEMNPLLHGVAMMRKWWFLQRTGGNTAPSIQFWRQDLWQTALHDAAVVTLYAYPPMMVDLGAKLRRELPTGAVVVSNQYPIPGWKPCRDNDSEPKDDEIVFVYKMPPTLVHDDEERTKNSSLPVEEKADEISTRS